MRRPHSLLILLAGAALSGAATLERSQSPTSRANALLSADRAFAATATRTDFISAVVAMLTPDALMPVPGNGFAEGPAAIRTALARDSLNVTSRAAWTPIRVGISADGQQGFTYGYIELTRADGSTAPGKYLAYWELTADGWRVTGYKRGRRAPGEVSRTPLAPALPDAIVAPRTERAVVERHRVSLAQAERDFSAEAQSIGLGPAFEKFGSADAMNMGGPASATLVFGNVEIAKAVSAGSAAGTSPVTWGPDHRVIVASSGDLGVTFGLIVPKTAAGEAPAAGIPFFTVWRRPTPSAPWRYVAE